MNTTTCKLVMLSVMIVLPIHSFAFGVDWGTKSLVDIVKSGRAGDYLAVCIEPPKEGTDSWGFRQPAALDAACEYKIFFDLTSTRAYAEKLDCTGPFKPANGKCEDVFAVANALEEALNKSGAGEYLDKEAAKLYEQGLARCEVALIPIREDASLVNKKILTDDPGWWESLLRAKFPYCKPYPARVSALREQLVHEIVNAENETQRAIYRDEYKKIIDRKGAEEFRHRYADNDPDGLIAKLNARTGEFDRAEKAAKVAQIEEGVVLEQALCLRFEANLKATKAKMNRIQASTGFVSQADADSLVQLAGYVDNCHQTVPASYEAYKKAGGKRSFVSIKAEAKKRADSNENLDPLTRLLFGK